MTPWDSTKVTEDGDGTVDSDEQLTADEWNRHVTDGHFPGDALNQGTDANGNPVVTDPANGDQVVWRYDPSAGQWEVVNTDLALNTNDVTNVGAIETSDLNSSVANGVVRTVAPSKTWGYDATATALSDAVAGDEVRVVENTTVPAAAMPLVVPTHVALTTTGGALPFATATDRPKLRAGGAGTLIKLNDGCVVGAVLDGDGGTGTVGVKSGDGTHDNRIYGEVRDFATHGVLLDSCYHVDVLGKVRGNGAGVVIRNSGATTTSSIRLRSGMQSYVNDSHNVRIRGGEAIYVGPGLYVGGGTTTTAIQLDGAANWDTQPDRIKLDRPRVESVTDGVVVDGGAGVELVSPSARGVSGTVVSAQPTNFGDVTRFGIIGGGDRGSIGTSIDINGSATWYYRVMYDATSTTSESANSGFVLAAEKFEFLNNAVDFGGVQPTGWSGDDTADSMTADPESSAESGYIEVAVGGATKQVPFYDP